MAVYDVFKASALDTEVRAILDKETWALEDYLEDYKNKEETSFHDSEGELTVVGGLGGRRPMEIGGDEDDGLEEVIGAWSRDIRNIVWVNEPRHIGLDMVHLTVSHSNKSHSEPNADLPSTETKQA